MKDEMKVLSLSNYDNSVKDIMTERLLLQEITEKDTEQIVQWRAEPDVYRFFRFPHAITEEEHLKWFHKIYLPDKNQISFMLIEKKSNKQIGVVGVKRIGSDSAEASYLLDKTAQGKGYASEAVQRITEFLKEYWGCKKVIAEIHKGNHASIKMIQKLGFQKKFSHGNFEIFERDSSCISEQI